LDSDEYQVVGGFIVRKGILFIIFALVALATTTHALIITEKSLSTSGFASLFVTSPTQTLCDDFDFTPFVGYAEAGNDTVLTLNVETLPLNDPDSNVTVFLNDSLLQTIHSKDLLSNGNIHLLIPAEQQESLTNTVRICGSLSSLSQNLRVHSNTMLGLYQQPRFNTLNAFQTLIAGNKPVLGEPIDIELFLTNLGGESVDVSIDYRKYELDYIPLLKGETGFAGTILPGETKKLSYNIKPLRAVSILLPPAVLTYTNIFGEKIVQESTRPFLLVDAPEFNVRAAFLIPQVRVNVNESVNVQWVAQNDGIVPVNGINATYTVYPEGTISPASATIETLSPAKAVTQNFTVTFSKPGIYTLGCYLSPRADPTLTTNCQSATIEVIEPNTGITLLFSLLLLLIAIAVYAYIYVLPQRAPREPAPKRGRFHSEASKK
jgi:hypothetical protein